MASATREGVEDGGAVPGVAARQDVRRIGGPEEDALAPQVGRPGFVDLGAVGEEPAADHRLGKSRATLARCGRGKIAQPGEAFELLEHGARRRLGKVDVGERQAARAGVEPAGEQGLAALAVARDMVTRNGGELERLAAVLEPGEERAARKPADDVALGLSRHPPPRSVRILSA